MEPTALRPPFSTEQFLGIFVVYNNAIWPVQIAAYALALAAIALTVKKTRITDPTVSLFLGLLWLWTGWVYHIAHFTAINKAAYGFGALFLLQGLLFLSSGVFRGRLSFNCRPTGAVLVGATMILYAMLIYPLLGHLFGHAYPQSPTFGVTPCPLTIFTFGLLLWADGPVPPHLLAIPLLWSTIGFFAAVHLGIREDLLLLAAGVVGTVLIAVNNRRFAVRSN